MRYVIGTTLMVMLILGRRDLARADGENGAAPFCRERSCVMEFRSSPRPECLDGQNPNGDPDTSSAGPMATECSAEIMNDLGVKQAQNRQGAPDYEKALSWFYKAASLGNMDALHNLGVMYSTGRGVSRNDTTAARWFRLAAEGGDVEAQNILGVMYETGQGVPRRDAEAIRWYRLAAGKWHVAAQENLARMYLASGPLPDAPETARWRQLSATRKISEAARMLGAECRPRNGAEAAIWFRIAAMEGDTDASYVLGTIFDSGQGGAQNVGEAARWYLQAAKRGHAEAQYSIGLLYATGHGVERNLVQAYAWLNVAAEKGLQKAAGKRDLLEKEMPRADFYAARRLQREWYQSKAITSR